MPPATATKVELYKATRDLARSLYKDSYLERTLRNAIIGGKKGYYGIPFGNHLWVLWKIDPDPKYLSLLAEYKRFLSGDLSPEELKEFPDKLISTFKDFYNDPLKRGHLEGEVNKYEAGEVEYPGFVTADEHQELVAAQSLPSEGARSVALENFTGARMPQVHTPTIPHVPVQGTVHLPGEVTSANTSEVGFDSSEVKAGAVPEAFGEWKDIQQVHVPTGHEEFKPPQAGTQPSSVISNVSERSQINPEISRSARNDNRQVPLTQRIGANLRNLQVPRVPQGLTLPVGKFIRKNVTTTRLVSGFTGVVGGFVGYGLTHTVLGTVAGGVFGGSVPTLIKQKGAGQLMLSGGGAVANTGANVLTGLSSGGRTLGAGASRVGANLGGLGGGPGKKAAIIFLLGFLFLAVFLVGFAPASVNQPGTGTPTAGGGGVCPDQTTIDQNKRDQNNCHYFGLGVDLFNTTISPTAVDGYINKYSSIFINAGKGDIIEFKRRVDYIKTSSQQAGLNPVLFLGYWKTESNFSTQGNRDLGCSPDAVNFDEQVDCALGVKAFSDPRKNPIANCARSKDANSVACSALKSVRSTLDKTNPIKYPVSTFDDFAEAHGSRDPNLNGPGTTNNNCISTYNKLVEVAEELNACKVSAPAPPPPVSGAASSCPIDGGRISCGSYEGIPGKVSACHCTPNYPPRVSGTLCSPLMSGSTLTRTGKSIDVMPVGRNGQPGDPVKLPTIEGQPLKWQFLGTEIDRKGYGFLRLFKSDPTPRGIWSLYMIHVDQNNPSLGAGVVYNSGDTVAQIGPGQDHVHINIGLNIANFCLYCDNQFDTGWLFPDRDLNMCVN